MTPISGPDVLAGLAASNSACVITARYEQHQTSHPATRHSSPKPAKSPAATERNESAIDDSHSLDNRQIGEANMQDGSSTDARRQRGRRRREERPRIETVGGDLRIWRDQRTNEIVLESPVFASGMLCGGLISLSARHARHLANSLLLFAAEAESSPTFTAAASPIQVVPDE
jgi:hypothetical protein